ncbi:D-amino acid dehydrogenase [Palleronia sediminis]|uniref:D-amino acid dehydrogenase n=2 Tax=Palleronia sediminis TaxID=2547833 RepID=A0A4R6AGB7_9RHOB|nr:D-amino acid dehydrogenase [Palleronia sediminis]TDL81488.1 D-amino acid dehydrogenase [Palleronia sediminis]
MKVVVMGAGVIGVTTAYYLAKQGAEVVVIDRQTGPGLETSYANAGQLSYGMSSPWAAPGIPKKAVKWMFMKRRPLFIWPLIDPVMWKWCAQMVRNCNEESYRINKGRMVRVSSYSRDVMPDLIDDTGIAYDGRQKGTLQLFRTAAQMKASKADQDILDEYDSPYEVLGRDACIAVEPALAEVRNKFVGGLRLTADRTGDCRMFTIGLTEKCAEMGVEFQYGQTIRSIAVENDEIAGVETEIAGRIAGDAYVCAMGSYAVDVLNPVGIKLPIYPVKGYSVTLPVVEDAFAPQSTIMDETHKVAITRLGDRIRVAGQAEIAGYSDRLGPHATDTVKHVIADLFPRGGDISKAEGWTGLRPMTPDGTPVLGATRYPNLFLNTGHGTLGWTMACGSGKAVADAVLGKTPEISMEGLTAARYGN